MEFNKQHVGLAYEILGGIPESAIDLDSYRQKEGESLSCGTICCGAGWLALHPHFQELGLQPNPMGVPQYYAPGDGSIEYSPVASLDKLFGNGSFIYLFRPYRKGLWDTKLLREKPGMSHKELLLARLKKAYHSV